MSEAHSAHGRRFRLWLAALVLFAAAVRLVGIDWDQRHSFHPDERRIAYAVEELSFSPLQLNPHFFAYGSFLLYVTRAVASLQGLIQPSWAQYTSMIHTGRAVSGVVGALTVLLLVLLGARLYNRSVGLLASNPLSKGGAIDVDACRKATSFLVLCDSFNIPLILLVDTPGFVIGIEGEKQKAPGKIMNFMQALQMCTVPKLSVIMRKTYGQAYLNMGGGRNSDDVVAWPTAEISFMDPHFATEIVTWGQQASEQTKQEIREQMEKDNSAYGLAEIYGVQAVISPADTRRYLIQQLEIHQLRLTGGIGTHRMSAWPTTY